MFRVLLPLSLILVLFFVASCGEENTVTGPATGPTVSGIAEEKKGTPPPPIEGLTEDELFLMEISEMFITMDWTPVAIPIERSGGSFTSTAGWDGYPVTVHVAYYPQALTDGYPVDEVLSVWLPSKLINGGVRYIPRNCLMYRLFRAPWCNSEMGEITIDFPIVPWLDPDTYSGSLQGYSLSLPDPDGSVQRENFKTVFMSHRTGGMVFEDPNVDAGIDPTDPSEATRNSLIVEPGED